ncbi:hypothetical protein U2181_15375, partial [Listeria monocytogenes]|uniref:hypothetical protein n=1 Tax=Listeria monocytogenes TaxID=1639 RepID=UPI002FDC2EE1
MDPNRRNLDFVALSWDGKKVVEHPAKPLDPEAIRQQNRRSLKKPYVLEPEAETKEALWIGGAVLLIAFFILLLGLFFWL